MSPKTKKAIGLSLMLGPIGIIALILLVSLIVTLGPVFLSLLVLGAIVLVLIYIGGRIIAKAEDEETEKNRSNNVVTRGPKPPR